MAKNVIDETGKDVVVRLAASATASMKHDFSHQHLWAAEFFAEECREIETAGDEDIEQSEKNRHRACVTGAVLSAVASIEATINELYLDAWDSSPKLMASLGADNLSNLKTIWEEFEKEGVLKKYRIALGLCKKEAFDQGGQPHQDAADLIKLRNALVHYKSEWDDKPGTHRKLEKRLTDKFDLCSLYGKGSGWFPHLCLSAGCAEWAVATARIFMTDFFRRMEIPNRVREPRDATAGSTDDE